MAFKYVTIRRLYLWPVYCIIVLHRAISTCACDTYIMMYANNGCGLLTHSLTGSLARSLIQQALTHRTASHQIVYKSFHFSRTLGPTVRTIFSLLTSETSETSVYATRSPHFLNLIIPWTRTTLDRRAASVDGLRLWNSLLAKFALQSPVNLSDLN